MSSNNLKVQDLRWRTARRSAGNGACVEIASANGQIAIRDSKDREGPALKYSASVFRSFLDAAKNRDIPS
jgi:hypothetical protein